MAAEIIGHRGAARYAPENTLVSVETALSMEASGVEIDVRMTRDKKIVAVHDAGTKRTTGIDMKVEDSDYKNLSGLDAGRFMGLKFAGERIPLISDVAAAIPNGKKFFVEVKCGPEVLPGIIETVREFRKEKDTFIISFSLGVVAASKELAPDIGALWIVEEKNQVLSTDQILKIVSRNSLDGLDAHYRMADKKLIDAVHSAGKKIYVWTVDSAGEALALDRNGVDGIASNAPDVIIKALRGN